MATTIIPTSGIITTSGIIPTSGKAATIAGAAALLCALNWLVLYHRMDKDTVVPDFLNMIGVGTELSREVYFLVSLAALYKLESHVNKYTPTLGNVLVKIVDVLLVVGALNMLVLSWNMGDDNEPPDLFELLPIQVGEVSDIGNLLRKSLSVIGTFKLYTVIKK